MMFLCPICKNSIQWAGNPYRPFCSERCRLIDLGDWASGRYSIPGEPVPAESVPLSETEEKISSTENHEPK
ncbi:MAG: DNA gyrase inhibitor YacG [Deltaproteobacteria bacterium]|nr:DNA gyrase inhibitor YacG [Deltaproteobacteria bacterium]